MATIPKTARTHFLVRVIRDEVSLEEREYFESWLKESEKNKEVFSSLLLLWDKAGETPLPPSPDIEAQWEKILNHLDEKEIQIPTEVIIKRQNRISEEVRKYLFSFKYRYAILTLLIMSAFGVFVYNYISIQSNSFSEVEEVQKVKLEEISVPEGRNLIITLTDGTQVKLFSGSRLKYPKVFSNTIRQIGLNGEAYFIVKQDKKHPFVVLTGNTKIVVTGTEFNVRYKNNVTNILVTSGSVKAISKDGNKYVTLAKGEAATVSESGEFVNTFQVPEVEREVKHNYNLIFNAVTLKEIMNKVSANFNADVIFENTLAENKRITGNFNHTSLDEILSIISFTTDVNIIHSGSKIIIK